MDVGGAKGGVKWDLGGNYVGIINGKLRGEWRESKVLEIGRRAALSPGLVSVISDVHAAQVDCD